MICAAIFAQEERIPLTRFEDESDEDILGTELDEENEEEIDGFEQIRTLRLSRKDQLRVFLAMVNSWGWIVAIPEDEEENGTDIVGLVVGQPHWVKQTADIIESETGVEFVIPEKNNEPSQTH